MAVSADDVKIAYRLFLGREAENDDVVQRIVDAADSIQVMRLRFINSTEFRQKVGLLQPGGSKPLNWPPILVETDVSAEALGKMRSHIEANWQSLGETEPHWSVLTDKKFRADQIGENIEVFYNSGDASLGNFKAAAERSGRALNPAGRCFELGCGVGRVTLSLARTFSHVIASDISLPHLRLANQIAVERGARNVEFVHLGSLDYFEHLPDYDYFFSVIVFQHNPPPIIKKMLTSILSSLKPGGLAYFQIPTYKKGYHFSADQYLASARQDGKMEGHFLPQHEIFQILERTSCFLLEVREDAWTGSPDSYFKLIPSGQGCRSPGIVTGRMSELSCAPGQTSPSPPLTMIAVLPFARQE